MCYAMTLAHLLMSNLLVSEQKMQNFKLKQGKLCSNSLKAKGLSIYLDIGVFPSHSFIIFEQLRDGQSLLTLRLLIILT